MDPARFPHLSAYIAGLPNGFDAFPECRVKASTYRQGLDGLKVPIEASELPEPLADMIANPLPVSAWVPEVHNIAMYMAIADLRHPQREQFLDYMYSVFADFYASPLYRVLFFVTSPRVLLKGSSRTWGRFRRGTKLEFLSADEHGYHGRIVYPEGVFNRLACESFARGIEAAYHAAGSKKATVSVVEWTPTYALTRSILG